MGEFSWESLICSMAKCHLGSDDGVASCNRCHIRGTSVYVNHSTLCIGTVTHIAYLYALVCKIFHKIMVCNNKNIILKNKSTEVESFGSPCPCAECTRFPKMTVKCNTWQLCFKLRPQLISGRNKGGVMAPDGLSRILQGLLLNYCYYPHCQIVMLVSCTD